MATKKTNQSLILGIALLVSFLINLPRVLALLNVVDSLGSSINSANIPDVVFRFVFLGVFAWFVLLFNLNSKKRYARFSKLERTVISVVVNAVLLFIAVTMFPVVYEAIIGNSLTRQELNIAYFVYIVVLIILIFISRILNYQIIHQQDVVEKETLKQESLKNELEALKNQVNPHFLFNSLNSLNALIRDNKQATTFVNKLSFMYRYILQSGTNDLVSLKEELKFLESYIYLIETRYRERFSIDISIDDKWMQEEIPAMSLQLLVENAVKHNEISESNPLSVSVYSDEDGIVVKNKIKPRKTFVDSTGNGLVNLNKRFKMLKKMNISISNNDELFIVKLPLN
ncbi:histidine kinase [Winogradskyella sp. 3972H.M.0a.05]|uniref:sensor histidine kinase n=1 Tax=Winogradskyella sp. 3972H.M.0a.05 TaxID=2950277 RepID=UPI00339983F6